MASAIVDPDVGADEPTEVVPRDAAIEGLRAIAALAVFTFHLGFFTFAARSDNVGAVFTQLDVGVWIFFVISGYLLYLPFARVHAGTGDPVRIGSYFVRRVFRIFPAYWVAMGLVPWLLVPSFRFRDWATAVRHATLAHEYVDKRVFVGVQSDGLPQAWTLSVELAFYAFLPVFAAIVARSARGQDIAVVERNLLTGFGVFGIAAYAWHAWGDAGLWVGVLPAHLTPFIVGMAGAVAVARGQPADGVGVAHAWSMRRWWLLGTCVFAALVVTRMLIDDVSEPWFIFSRHVGFTIIAGAFVLGAVLRPDGSAAYRALTSRLAGRIGTISYGIYLWHFGVIFWVVNHWFPPTKELTFVKTFGAALPATLVVATASWFVIEKPAIAIARHLTKRRRASVDATADPRTADVR